MKRTTGGPPRLVELASIPLKKPAILEDNLSLAKVLRKPIATGTAKQMITVPINIFRVVGLITLIIQAPKGIPNRLLSVIGRIRLKFTLTKERSTTKILLSKVRNKLITTTATGFKVRSSIGARIRASPNPARPRIKAAKRTAHKAKIQGVLKISRLCMVSLSDSEAN